MRKIILTTILIAVTVSFRNMFPTEAQQTKPPETVYLIRPAAVFDGDADELHRGWIVLVRGTKIEAFGPVSEIKAPPEAKVGDLPNLTLMPDLIRPHWHMQLHPDSESF